MNRSLAALILAGSALASLSVSSCAWAQSDEPAQTAAPAAAPAAAPPAAAPAVAPANPDCAARASEKKLAGAALDSFMKKCARETATANCDVAAGEKKLKGAAKKSFTKKCVKDAIIAQ